MSGGSWDYVFSKFDETAERLLRDGRLERRALGRLVAKIGRAMKAIEWVDSCDDSPGDEVSDIRSALGGDQAAILAELREAIEVARAVSGQLSGAIMRAEAIANEGKAK
jgi:hypothetical protein